MDRLAQLQRNATEAALERHRQTLRSERLSRCTRVVDLRYSDQHRALIAVTNDGCINLFDTQHLTQVCMLHTGASDVSAVIEDSRDPSRVRYVLGGDRLVTFAVNSSTVVMVEESVDSPSPITGLALVGNAIISAHSDGRVVEWRDRSPSLVVHSHSSLTGIRAINNDTVIVSDIFGAIHSFALSSKKLTKLHDAGRCIDQLDYDAGIGAVIFIADAALTALLFHTGIVIDTYQHSEPFRSLQWPHLIDSRQSLIGSIDVSHSRLRVEAGIQFRPNQHVTRRVALSERGDVLAMAGVGSSIDVYRSHVIHAATLHCSR